MATGRAGPVGQRTVMPQVLPVWKRRAEADADALLFMAVAQFS